MLDDCKPNASQLHRKTFETLKKMFPLATIKQEYPIKVGNKTLFIDILVEKPFRVAFECHGEQHFRYVGHFHDSPADLHRQQRHDASKAYWCEQNGIPLVVIRYDDLIDEEFIQNLIEEGLEA